MLTDINPFDIIEFNENFNELVVNTVEGVKNFPIDELDPEMILSFVTDGYLGVGILVAMGIDEFWRG